jgi:hypothetical protein
MGKQEFNGAKKIIWISLLVLYVISVTAAAVSTQSSNSKELSADAGNYKANSSVDDNAGQSADSYKSCSISSASSNSCQLNSTTHEAK